MGQLSAVLKEKLVAFDSAPLIYYLEQHPSFAVLTDELFDTVRQGLARSITSILTLMEVLVLPLREGRKDLADDYRRLLSHTRGLTLLPVDRAICERAARLRADHNWLRTPDALQLATALEHGADLIVTNDERWRPLTEIKVIVLRDFMEAGP